MRKLRRNDIVMEKHNPGYVCYGRVNRLLDDETVEVIDSGRYVTVYLMDDLILKNEYQGYWSDDSHVGFWDDEEMGVPRTLRQRFPVFFRMPSLRKLKQNTARYNPQVWRHYRKRHGLPDFADDQNRRPPSR